MCTRCERAAFPRPLWCPACGGADWREEELGAGRVEETTYVRRVPGRTLAPPSRLGTVRLDAGPVLVARLAPGASARGRVWVELDGGAPVARPIRPARASTAAS